MGGNWQPRVRKEIARGHGEAAYFSDFSDAICSVKDRITVWLLMAYSKFVVHLFMRMHKESCFPRLPFELSTYPLAIMCGYTRSAYPVVFTVPELYRVFGMSAVVCSICWSFREKEFVDSNKTVICIHNIFIKKDRAYSRTRVTIAAVKPLKVLSINLNSFI